MWIKDGSDTICLFGCIESDSLANTTWQHFPKLSFQIKTIQILKLNSLAPETVSPATHYPIPGLLSKYEPILIFCLFYKGFSDLRLISDQQNLLLGFSLGVYIVFREINCHLAVLSLQAPQALLSLPSQAVRIKQALGNMIKIHWIEKSTSKKVTYKVKPEFAPASKPLSSEEW